MTADAAPAGRECPLDIAEHVRANGFDFLDLGCSHGNSLKEGVNRFGGTRGLGIDIDERKVEAATAAGLDALIYRIEDLPDRKMVRFVTMCHFLEHVSDMRKVHGYVAKACSIANEFVFIKQPYFDADTQLAKLGLKLFWSDWTGHQNRMTSFEFGLLCRDLLLRNWITDFMVYVKHPIGRSDDHRVHPIASPIDQHQYDAGKHPPKPDVGPLGFPVFYETVCVISTGPNSIKDVVGRYRPDAVLFDQNSFQM